MKLWVKITLISVGVLLIAAVVILIYSSRGHGVPGVDVMDGPGMVYTWTDYDLYGNWTEVNVSEGFNAGSIEIDKNTITINDGYGNKSKYKYKLPDNVEEEGRPEGEVYLEIEDLKDFENLIFHFDELDGDGGTISVLSGTIFEYDGRGEIVVTEYVHDGDLYRVPSDFRSSLAKGRNSWEGVPPMMNVNN